MTRIAALALIASLVACKRAPDPEDAIRDEWVKQIAFREDAGGAWRLTSTRDVFFDDGWYPMEYDPNKGMQGETWRWMRQRSLTRLRTRAVTMHLVLVGWVPYEIFHTPPAITIRWNGARVDSFLAPRGHFTKELDVTPEMQRGREYADLVIDSSTVGSPRGEWRELAYGLSEIRWEPSRAP
jgi:hypothetical protein